MRSLFTGIVTLIAVAIFGTHHTKISSININSTKLSKLQSQAPEIKKTALQDALIAYKNVEKQHLIKKPILTVIDFSVPSNKPRLWIFNLVSNKLILKTYVAHGANSGGLMPRHFSNKNSSHESSLGTFVTRSTYYGSKGLSLNLQGLEKGVNDNAYARRVVVHGAWYVEPSFVRQNGYAGRSWGCPSVARSLAPKIINTIKNGSVLFAYYPDKEYLEHSKYLRT